MKNSAQGDSHRPQDESGGFRREDSVIINEREEDHELVCTIRQPVGNRGTWLDSPLERKITRLEEASSMPETMAERQEYAAEVKNSPPPAQRLKLLRELDSAVKGTESGMNYSHQAYAMV